LPDDASELVLIDPSLSVSDPMRRLILHLCELGYLFKKVHAFASCSSQRMMDTMHAFTDTAGSMDIDSGVLNQNNCFTSQAFSYAVSKELSEYYRLMAVLETRASGQLTAPKDQPPSEETLTLRRLYVWLAEASRKMRILAVLIDSISHLKGGALASALYAHSRTGDQFAHKFIMRLLRKVSVPIFNMIKTWVFEGEFSDPHHEFFIVDNMGHQTSSVSQGFDLWRMGYTINQNMLPDFVSPTLAEKILRAGKSINFLRSRCGDVEWVQEQAAASDASETVSYTNLETLQTLAENASSKVDLRLIQIMTKKFSLPLHFKALRRYILLGQGDFVQSLLDCLKPELDKEMSKVSEVVVMGCIRAAMHSSNAMYDDEDVLERLCMKRMGTFTTQSGWDVFALDYRIDASSPLSTVIPPTTMTEYQKVFRLLWKLKKAEMSVNECWKGLKCLCRSVNRPDLGVGNRLRELLLLAFNVRSKLSHFCINFQYYIMFEVLEGAWKDFTSTADKATDLDALIHAHEAYVESIISKCLLDSTPSADALRSLLTEYFRLIDDFAKTIARLVSDAQQILHFLFARLKAALQQGNWAASPRPDVDDVPMEYYQEMKNHFASVLDKYDMFIGSFTERVSGEAHIDLRFLMFRLDFDDSCSKQDVDAEAMISEETMQE